MDGSSTVVLIPYYNAMGSLVASLASIGPDEPTDVLIVDDGSLREPVDEAAARAAWAGPGDLHVLRQPRNGGIVRALNAGLDWITARGGYEFVARLDCGDRNVPGRIATQLAHMREHPSLLLLGGAAAFVDTDDNEQFVYRLPEDKPGIIAMMRRNSAFMHPAVMFRTSALPVVGRYPDCYPAAEDYAFFWRFVEAGEVANLPEVLIRYELDPGGISLSGRRTQLESRLAVQRDFDDGSWAARTGRWRTEVLLRMPYKTAFRLKRAMYRRRHGDTP